MLKKSVGIVSTINQGSLFLVRGLDCFNLGLLLAATKRVWHHPSLSSQVFSCTGDKLLAALLAVFSSVPPDNFVNFLLPSNETYDFRKD